MVELDEPDDADTPSTLLATVSSGEIVNSTLSRVEANGVWRLVLDIEIHRARPVELKAYLSWAGRDAHRNLAVSVEARRCMKQAEFLACRRGMACPMRR